MRERPRAALMLALYRSGRHAEALRAYQSFRDMLAEDTGLEPSAELARLKRRIVERDPSLDTEGRVATSAATSSTRSSPKARSARSIGAPNHPSAARLRSKS